MTSFIINFYKLFLAIWLGYKIDEDFRILVMVLIILLSGATYFYWQVENWSFIDSRYFSVMTISTIGYGDLVPTTSYSKIFTIVYSLLGIGVFFAVVTKIVQVTVAEKTS